MLIRWVHFDQNAPLLPLLKHLWERSQLDQYTVNHEEFIAKALALPLETFPLLQSFEENLIERLWILYKYFWYTTLSDGSESTFERFLLWHRVMLQNKYLDCSPEEIEERLQKLSNQLLPLSPFKNVS